MLTRSTRLKLIAFGVIGALALAYGLVDLLRVQRVVHHPHVVNAVFAYQIRRASTRSPTSTSSA